MSNRTSFLSALCQMGGLLPGPRTVHSGGKLLLIMSDLSYLLLWLRDTHFLLIESYFSMMSHILNKNKST